jgi:hypothetical protein
MSFCFVAGHCLTHNLCNEKSDWIYKLFLASNVKCKAPARLKESVATTYPKRRYSVGETVIFQCMTGHETETHTCLTDGSWSGGNMYCVLIYMCPKAIDLDSASTIFLLDF